MKCERIQEILLTDYLDKELNPAIAKQIEEHLVDCLKCREFLSEARQISALPFLETKKFSLPLESQEKVWLKIKKQIEAERPQSVAFNPLLDFISTLKSFVLTPRPVFVLSAVAVIVLMAVVYLKPFNNQEIVRPQAPEIESGETYSDYVAKELFVSQTDDNGDYGTAIEEYFL